MHWLAGALVALLIVLGGCSDEAPTGPSTSDLQAQRAALAAKVAERKQAGQPEVAQPAAAAAAADEATEFGSVGSEYVYDPTGKRDPFRSIRWERAPSLAEQAGPLEQFELEQLSVSAVIWDTRQPRALVQDPSGRTHIVQEGTRLGKNAGRVIHIGDNLVLVKETYVDFAGEQTTKDVEIYIRRSQGG